MFPRGRHNHLFFNLRETGPLCGHVSISLEYTLCALPDQLHCIHPILCVLPVEQLLLFRKYILILQLPKFFIQKPVLVIWGCSKPI